MEMRNHAQGGDRMDSEHSVLDGIYEASRLDTSRKVLTRVLGSEKAVLERPLYCAQIEAELSRLAALGLESSDVVHH